MDNLFFGISLTAAFLGGMVALFAPCCLTFLFPSYLGTIFRARGRVVFLTIVFALGIAVILVPVALGFRFIVSLFDQFHTTTYLLGALLMVILGIMTFFETRIAFPFLPSYRLPENVNVVSVFTLGIFSGITSSCCAPVLFAAIALSSLSPTLFSAVIVTLTYVLGIVAPLFLLSVVYDKVTSQYLTGFKKNIQLPLKIIASFVFILSGIIIAALALSGRIQMEENLLYGAKVRNLIFNLSSRFTNPLSDLLVIIVFIVLIFLLIRERRHGKS